MMHTSHFRIAVVVLLCFVAYSMASKYSKSVNERGTINFENEVNPFRMSKVNLLWGKGKKKLKSIKLADLYADLTIQDKYEAQLKKARVSNADPDGKIEAKALKHYARIVEHYGLDETGSVHGFRETNEVLSGYEFDLPFEDSKLQSMWMRAIEAGFSAKDLKTLREEFQHQQLKINEFNLLHKEPDMDSNAIEPNPPNSGKYKSKDDYHKMKAHHMSVRDGYVHLETLVSSMPAGEPEFSDSRVYKLWAMAKKINWTVEELNRFKVDLKHFEHRLGKHTHYKEQLELSTDALKSSDEVPEKHAKLEEKVQFYDRTVNKLYTDLKMKVDRNLHHQEL